MAVFAASDLLHPFEESATRELESMADLPAAVAAFTRLYREREADDFPRAAWRRLGPDHLPGIHRLLPPLYAAFGIPEPALYLQPGSPLEASSSRGPELFVAADGMHVHAFGLVRTSIMIPEGVLGLLRTDEIEAVIAHECGHILMAHVPYHSMSRFFDAASGVGSPAAIPGVARLLALATPPLRAALATWSRNSELSADRAAAAYLGSADAMTRAMFRFAGTTVDPTVDPEGVHSVQTLARTRPAADPALAARVREIEAWTATSGFRRLRDATRGRMLVNE